LNIKTDLNSQDEIHLSEFLRVIWQNKWLIALVACMVTLTGLAYAFLTTPLYLAQVTVIPPITNDLSVYNYERNSTTKLKPLLIADVFSVVRGVLLTPTTAQLFIAAENKPVSSAISLDSIKIVPESDIRYTIKAFAKSPNLAIEIIKKYIELANKITVSKINQTVKNEVDAALDVYNNDITVARNIALKEKANQLTRLNEALLLAQTLELKTPTHNAPANSISNAAYLRGSQALNAEINSLKNRSDNDAFSPQVVKLQNEYERLKGVQIPSTNVLLVHQEGEIVASPIPVSPDKKRIIIFSLILGLFLGLVLVIFQNRKLFA